MEYLNYIRIINGKFFVTDYSNKEYIELNDSTVTKENLKKEILKQLEKISTPINVRNLIYSSLCILSKCKVKNACKKVLKQEESDPLYQELSQFVLSLEQYQKLIKSSRKLKITEDQFIVLDINGVISSTSNEEINVKTIEEKIDSLESLDNEHITKNILINFFIEHFNVESVSLNSSNPVFKFLLDKVYSSKSYINYMHSKTITGFKNGEIFLKFEEKYLPLEPHITVEALKEQIILYLEKHRNVAKKSEIIFESLRILTGYKVSRKRPKYVTTHIGSVKREILVEDPLYLELCDFIETLPIFLENQRRIKEKNKQINDTLKNAKKQIELEHFLDNRADFYSIMQL